MYVIYVNFMNANLENTQFVLMWNCVAAGAGSNAPKSAQQCAQYVYVPQNKAFGA